MLAYALGPDFPVLSAVNFLLLCVLLYASGSDRRAARARNAAVLGGLSRIHKSTLLAKAHADQAATASVLTNETLAATGIALTLKDEGVAAAAKHPAG
jgi:hypothetical protein